MPELPEVETVRCQLQRGLVGRRFAPPERIEPFMLLRTAPEELEALLPGRTVEEVGRHGKFLLLRLTDDLYLTVHLGMTGQLLLLGQDEPLPAHARFVLPLEGAAERLVFSDMRKFGRVELTAGSPAPRVAQTGPDAWVGEWDADALVERLRGRATPLKAFLLDQRRLAGIGNIYADEILFGARLSPLRPAGTLTQEETRRLAREIRERLEEGVRLRGCSISDFVDTRGTEGGFQRVLRAYGRQGQACPRCGGTIVRTVVAGRGTAYCPTCQR